MAAKKKVKGFGGHDTRMFSGETPDFGEMNLNPNRAQKGAPGVSLLHGGAAPGVSILHGSKAPGINPTKSGTIRGQHGILRDH